jgi:hypothetical protein
VKDGALERTIKLNVEDGVIVVKEVGEDENYVTVEADRGDGSSDWITVRADATQLWKLAGGIASLFGGIVLSLDEQRTRKLALREKLFDVLERNESRCLDDDDDREVVLRELVKALSSRRRRSGR